MIIDLFNTAAVVNAQLATGSYVGLANLTGRRRYTADDMAELIAATGMLRFDERVPLLEWGLELLPLRNAADVWSIRFPLWRRGEPTPVVVELRSSTTSVDIVVESISIDPDYRPHPDRVPPEQIAETFAAMEARQRASRRPRGPGPAVAVADPPEVPVELKQVVDTVIACVLDRRYADLAAMATPDGMPPERILEVLSEFYPPWRLFPDDESTYTWDGEDDDKEYTVHLLLTDSEDQDLRIIFDVPRPVPYGSGVSFYSMGLM